MKSTMDSHLNFGDGDADIKLFKSMIPKNSMVTLETKSGYEKQLKDIEFMRNVM